MELSAIKNRWPISEEQKQRMVDRAFTLIDSSPDERSVIAAMKIVASIEAQNQEDEHKGDPLNEFKLRLLAIAAENGIELSAGGSAEASVSRLGDGSSEPE